MNRLAEAQFTFAPDAKYSTTLAYLAEVCVVLQDQERAEKIYGLLFPYRSMTVTAGITTVCLGAAGRYLGMLAALREDGISAEEHFETALELDKRMRAWPWLAHTQLEFAVTLRRRGRAADESRIRALSNEALGTASRFGIVALQERARKCMLTATVAPWIAFD